jgi:hypothetical protein
MKTTSIKAWATAAFAAALTSAFLATPARSHHSFAMYDQQITRTLTGKLTRFIPGANHAQLYFELVGSDGETVTDESGDAAVWGVEMGPAAQIAREGVTVKSFPIGTILTVTLNPLRDGRPFGALARQGGVLVKCGDTMPEGGCTEETGESFLGVGN